jgi:hypothetical protein
MQESARRDADHLEKVQCTMRALADAHDNGGVPPLLTGLKTKIAIDDMLLYKTWMDWDDFVKRMRKCGFEEYNYEAARAALIELADPPDRSAENALRAMENEVRGLVGKIPGFFFTSDSVIGEMLALVNLSPRAVTSPGGCATS